MIQLLDIFLVALSLIGAAAYLLRRAYAKRGRSSCCEDSKGSDRERIQVKIPKR